MIYFYDFLVKGEGLPEDPDTRAALDATDDPPAVISSRAMAGEDPTCRRALDLFIDCYADEAGNQALRFVATGGVYLAGGITPKIAPELNSDAFRATFEGDSPLHELRTRIPVHAVLEPRVGLLGPGVAALRQK